MDKKEHFKLLQYHKETFQLKRERKEKALKLRHELITHTVYKALL